MEESVGMGQDRVKIGLDKSMRERSRGVSEGDCVSVHVKADIRAAIDGSNHGMCGKRESEADPVLQSRCNAVVPLVLSPSPDYSSKPP